jgi:acetyl esterase/lipase
MVRAHRRAIVVACVLALAVSAWLVVHALPQATSANPTSTQEYLPGVSADVYLPSPAPASDAPVVVLVPGGGWHTADRAGLAPLAQALAGDGMVVVNATYRVADDGVRFPTPVQDIECAVAFAADRARKAGATPSRVILVGHSSGAHLAALAALAGPELGGTCPYPATVVDGFVGLAGAYDVAALADLAEPLIGASAASRPDLWRQADPGTWVRHRLRPCPLAVLLLHGSDDLQVSSSVTTGFGDELRRSGHPVRVVVVHGADHGSIYSAQVAEAAVRDWVRSGPAGCVSAPNGSSAPTPTTS